MTTNGNVSAVKAGAVTAAVSGTSMVEAGEAGEAGRIAGAVGEGALLERISGEARSGKFADAASDERLGASGGSAGEAMAKPGTECGSTATPFKLQSCGDASARVVARCGKAPHNDDPVVGAIRGDGCAEEGDETLSSVSESAPARRTWARAAAEVDTVAAVRRAVNAGDDACKPESAAAGVPFARGNETEGREETTNRLEGLMSRCTSPFACM